MIKFGGQMLNVYQDVCPRDADPKARGNNGGGGEGGFFLACEDFGEKVGPFIFCPRFFFFLSGD